MVFNVFFAIALILKIEKDEGRRWRGNDILLFSPSNLPVFSVYYVTYAIMTIVLHFHIRYIFFPSDALVVMMIVQN